MTHPASTLVYNADAITLQMQTHRLPFFRGC